MSDSKIHLHYWPIRGLGEPVVTLLNYLEIPYELHQKTSMEQMLKEKNALIEKGFLFANLPYIQDGETYLSETVNIMEYLCKKAKRTELIPTCEEYFKFHEMKGAMIDLKNLSTSKFYQVKTMDELKDLLTSGSSRWQSKLNAFEQILKKSDFVFGRLTYLDFYFAECIEMLIEFQKETEYDFFGNRTQVYVDYLKRFNALPQLVSYHKGESFKARPYNMPGMSVWN